MKKKKKKKVKIADPNEILGGSEESKLKVEEGEYTKTDEDYTYDQVCVHYCSCLLLSMCRHDNV